MGTDYFVIRQNDPMHGQDNGYNNVHLGKSSQGWTFLCNWNDRMYYHDKESFFHFVRKNIVVDESGTIIDSEEFLKMVLAHATPMHTELRGHAIEHNGMVYREDDHIIDGLRLSSSTTF